MDAAVFKGIPGAHPGKMIIQPFFATYFIGRREKGIKHLFRQDTLFSGDMREKEKSTFFYRIETDFQIARSDIVQMDITFPFCDGMRFKGMFSTPAEGFSFAVYAGFNQDFSRKIYSQRKSLSIMFFQIGNVEIRKFDCMPVYPCPLRNIENIINQTYVR